MDIRSELLKVFESLQETLQLEEGWPGGDWPLSGSFAPPVFEIVVGAMLTQNTSWKNVEKGLTRLREKGLTTARDLINCPLSDLEEAIRPVGFFRKKAGLLKRVASTILAYQGEFYSRVTREELLSIEGVGPETADAVLLYACAKPEFIADSYARRILRRYGLPIANGYGESKHLLEANLSQEVGFFRRFHALLVEHAKESCRKVPRCPSCVLNQGCKKGREVSLNRVAASPVHRSVEKS